MKPGAVVVAQGSYKDGGAIMLSDPGEDGKIDPLAHSDAALTRALRESFEGGAEKCSDAVGYTIPVFYFQLLKLIHDLITGEVYPDGPKVGYFEMEQASFFETCRLMNVQGASMVVGSDRYRLADGKVTHNFEEDVDQDAAKLVMIRTALRVFTR